MYLAADRNRKDEIQNAVTDNITNHFLGVNVFLKT